MGRKLTRIRNRKGLIKRMALEKLSQKRKIIRLREARGGGFVDAVDALLGTGANRALRLPDGKTAADFTRERGHSELARRSLLRI